MHGLPRLSGLLFQGRSATLPGTGEPQEGLPPDVLGTIQPTVNCDWDVADERAGGYEPFGRGERK